MFKLVIQDDEGKTTVVPLIRDEITIGRKEGNTIRLTERNVSRRHARILRNQGEVHIEDLGSYNGIRVNNARIAERVSLRVSDQVQIGDYKLYLKAEGVEQVDDARTVPIERVDGAHATAPTDAIAAIPSIPAGPTMPMASPVPIIAASPNPAISSAPTAPQIVGNPARTLVAISDSDIGGGRPVATAAAVAALTQTVGYGKLVVLSSNFAGKEFELSRPQMIIGRTDENDIVINHRSISRNHAKITREPESGRYTINDLNSSNGVRVNGSDYSKVELRRGDTIDLGHVRLRYIEAGEDFVFARDAEITDVPEGGDKRGTMIAIVLAVLVLGGVGAFFALRGNGNSNNGDQPPTPAPIDAAKATSAEIPADASTVTVTVTTPVDAATVAVVTVDAAGQTAIANTNNTGSGSNGSATTGGHSKQEMVEACSVFVDQRDWDKELDCAETKLRPLSGEAADSLSAQAKLEKGAMAANAKLEAALKLNKIGAAKSALDGIDRSSVYRSTAQAAYEKAKADAIEAARGDVNSFNRRHACGELKQYMDKLEHNEGAEVANPFKSTVAGCVPGDDHPGPHSGTGSGSATVQSATTACDAEDLKSKGLALYQSDPAKSLPSFEAALRCKGGDANLLALTFSAACAAKNLDKARAYFARLPPSGPNSQATLAATCARYGIDPHPK